MGVLDDLLNDPEVRDSYKRYTRKIMRIERVIGWMARIPIIGRLVHTFWFSLLDEGVRSTIKPRWGALTFAFLNDGISPTVWHTWVSITGSQDAGLYVGPNPVDGARRPPRSRAEADLWDRLWREAREYENAEKFLEGVRYGRVGHSAPVAAVDTGTRGG